ncbi:ECF-type sigma factor [Marinicella sp. W31]|uniref:ECF-type sigma factor n=1 Tax=Marinicella sp. W31 TaxID=3023713 RepID=UPI0037567C26
METSSGNISPEIDSLLSDWSGGDINARDKLVEMLYPHIHRIAHLHVKSQSATTLQTTEIVNEAYIRLSKQESVQWKNRNHFLAIASVVIRRVMFDHYRKKSGLKRGGHLNHITVDRIQDFIPEPAQESMGWIELNDLLDALAKIDKEAAFVVECKIIGGLTLAEISEVISKSAATTAKIWQFARSWLLLQKL